MRYLSVITSVFAVAVALVAAPPRAVSPARAAGDTASASSQDDPTQGQASLTGRYVLAMPEQAADSRIDEAIDDAVRGMSFARRPFARRRLQRDNKAFDVVHIRFPEDEIAIRFGDARAVRSPADGAPAPYVLPGGDRVKARQRQHGRRIVQRFQSDVGTRTNQLELSPDKQHLTLRVEVRSPHLPRPVRYSLRYQKAGAR